MSPPDLAERLNKLRESLLQWMVPYPHLSGLDIGAIIDAGATLTKHERWFAEIHAEYGEKLATLRREAAEAVTERDRLSAELYLASQSVEQMETRVFAAEIAAAGAKASQREAERALTEAREALNVCPHHGGKDCACSCCLGIAAFCDVCAYARRLRALSAAQEPAKP